jgi:signal transduction histidine kinase
VNIRLKFKVLLGIAALSLIVVLAFAYGASIFHRLEVRMQAVNDLYVPALKALNQVDNSFFLLESDLDKSFREGILRPKDTLESVLLSRLDFLGRLARAEGGNGPALQDAVADLSRSYGESAATLERAYSDWAGRSAYEAELSSRRADFRFRLKSLVRNIDQEMRSVSAEVQAELSRLGIVLTVALAFCCALAFILSYWLAASLRPLEVLADVMRNISRKGLDEKEVRRLADLPSSQDEIGTLSRESQKMASSLLDKSKALQDQKQILERAHLELARQNEELKSTQARLLHSEKLGLVGRMAAQMAHEIRNPLNALNLHAEILEDQLKNDPSAMESLDPLRREINRLITVTESYLDLSRGPRLQRGLVQLNEMVEELHELYQPLLKEKGIFFTCDLGSIPPLSVDRSQFSQVLANLLKNASEAFEESGREAGRFIRVITHFDEASWEVTISVMDNGVGIDSEQKKNIFSPFYTSKAQGTGLGLTFSRQVVEAHGGEIYFDSATMQGTKFTLKLPAPDGSWDHGVEAMPKEEAEWKATEQRS